MYKYRMESKQIKIGGIPHWVVSYPAIGTFYAFSQDFEQAVENLNATTTIYLKQCREWGQEIPKQDLPQEKGSGYELFSIIVLFLSLVLLLFIYVATDDTGTTPINHYYSIIEHFKPDSQGLNDFIESKYQQAETKAPELLKDGLAGVELGVNTGQVPNRAVAWYSRKTNKIYLTAIGATESTIFHEMGHHLDFKYDLSSTEEWKYIYATEWKAKKNYGSSSPSEAFAESISIYYVDKIFSQRNQYPQSMEFIKNIESKIITKTISESEVVIVRVGPS